MHATLPKSVLIVEDEVLARSSLRSIVLDAGISEVYACATAQKAREELGRQKYDFILMDINLGYGEDGISLARSISENEEVPIVFVTAYNDEEFFEEALDVTPCGFIGKPIKANDVERTIRLAYARFCHEKERTPSSADERWLRISSAYRYNYQSKILYFNDKPIVLRSTLRKFVDLLCKNAQTITTYETALYMIWGETGTMNSLRTLVYDLRRQLPDFPLVTHSKMGYSLAIA